MTKDSFAGPTGSPIVLLPWQRRLIGETFARDPYTGRRLARTALWIMGRKNGKSSTAAPIALAGLLLEGEGAEVYSVAADRLQAKLIFGTAKRTAELNPELAGKLRLFKDVIEYPAKGSIYRALSAEAPSQEGLSPTLVLFDELHAQPNRELYDVMALAMGARRDPLMLCVTTPGLRYDATGGDSIAYLLYQYGRRIAAGEVADPTFYMAAWEGPEGCAVDDPAAWEAANPGLDVILDRAELAAQAHKAQAGGMDESEFRVKRLSQWVTTSRSWFPPGVWDRARRPDRVVSSTEPIVLGFDGAWTQDSVALVGCTVEDHHVFVVGSWERPLDDPHYRADSGEIDLALRRALSEYRVVEVAADPHEWRAQIAAWAEEGIPVVEWPTNSLPRIIPATKEFYTAIVEQRLTHDGDPRLARHIANATIREDRFGVRVTKEHRGSPRKIDLAIASIAAYDRARFHETPETPPQVRFYI